MKSEEQHRLSYLELSLQYNDVNPHYVKQQSNDIICASNMYNKHDLVGIWKHATQPHGLYTCSIVTDRFKETNINES